MGAETFAELVERIGRFHVTAPEMRRAQDATVRALAAGNADEKVRHAYLAAARRYFEGFEREARTRLREVDRRLEEAAQVQFNLSAERAVAVKRIDATTTVLANIAAFEAGVEA